MRFCLFKKPVGIFIFASIVLPAMPQTTMFRGTADHIGPSSSTTSRTFGEKAWATAIQAPVRSSVAVGNGALFFGASNGRFYSLNQQTGAVNWTYITGAAIASSPAWHNGRVYFTDNSQTLYALNATTGKLFWKLGLGTSLPYEWAFDYFYSSPTLSAGKIVVGSKDGCIYTIRESDGQLIWKYKTGGIVRSTPAIKDGIIYVGDTEGVLHALQLNDGKEVWQFFIAGHSLKNEDFGFDRRAIISSPVVTADKVLVGGRDGFLYAVNKTSGKEIWRMDHQVSWVISSVAVKDSFVVTGTSDGRFIQAVHLDSGKELWKYRTSSIVWSSPVIDNNKVYIGSHDNKLYCLDLQTGRRLNSFQTQGTIFTSPVIHNALLYFGCDDGFLYALKPAKYTYPAKEGIKKFVYWEPGVSPYFKFGTDARIKEYLMAHGYTLLNSQQLASRLVMNEPALNSVIVFAANYFPTGSVPATSLRTWLNDGGKIVLLGNNPLVFKTDTATKRPIGLNFPLVDSILGIHYGPNDTRSFKGAQPAFATQEGEQWGLRGSWTAALSILPEKVDIILGKDENGLASAWVKKYHRGAGTGLVQMWVNPDGASDPEIILRVAEFGLGITN
jgi:eukaryotic-like serine/threonine-protein kinase